MPGIRRAQQRLRPAAGRLAERVQQYSFPRMGPGLAMRSGLVVKFRHQQIQVRGVGVARKVPGCIIDIELHLVRIDKS